LAVRVTAIIGKDRSSATRVFPPPSGIIRKKRRGSGKLCGKKRERKGGRFQSHTAAKVSSRGDIGAPEGPSQRGASETRLLRVEERGKLGTHALTAKRDLVFPRGSHAKCLIFIGPYPSLGVAG